MFEYGTVHKCVDLVDLVKILKTSISDYVLVKIGVDTVESGPHNVC